MADREGIDGINLKVAVVDSDFYALHAINAYLAWDRRTRVLLKTASLAGMWAKLDLGNPPDVVVLDANHLGSSRDLKAAIINLRQRIEGLAVVCLAQFADEDLLLAAAEAGARAFLLKEDVRLHIASALCYAHRLAEGRFLYSRNLEKMVRSLRNRQRSALLSRVKKLPGPQSYAGLTPRIRHAIELYAVEGMSHSLIADEMGITKSTVRGYVKTAYEQLGLGDEEEPRAYLVHLNQQERAFMRLTALEDFADSG